MMTSWNRKQWIEFAWEAAPRRERWSARSAFLAIIGVNLVAWAAIAKLVTLIAR